MLAITLSLLLAGEPEAIALERALDPATPAAAKCLGDDGPRGILALKLALDETGAVTGLSRTAGPDAPALVACLSRAVKGLRVELPGAPRFTIAYAVLSPGTTAGPSVILSGGLHQHNYPALILAQHGGASGCVEPTMKGFVAFEFEIAPDGTVKQASLQDLGLVNPAALQCLRDRLPRVRFPPSASGRPQIIRMPLGVNLTPGEPPPTVERL